MILSCDVSIWKVSIEVGEFVFNRDPEERVTALVSIKVDTLSTVSVSAEVRRLRNLVFAGSLLADDTEETQGSAGLSCVSAALSLLS